jgi:hypothetical protein
VESVIAIVISLFVILVGIVLLKGSWRDFRYYKKGLGRKLSERKNGKLISYMGTLAGTGRYVTSKPTKFQKFSLLLYAISSFMLGLFAIGVGLTVLLLYIRM